MKKTLMLFVLLSCTIAYAQRPTPEQITPLFKKTPPEVKSFLLSKGFVSAGRDDIAYTYIRHEWGNDCIIKVIYKADRLNNFSIHQSVLYYDSHIAKLYEQQFVLTKSCREDTDLPPIAFPGSTYRFDNNSLKLWCFVVTADGNGFYMNYARL